MIDAMRRNDSASDGRFYVGVHSTGIYCLPSCRARAPRIENVRFYESRTQAEKAGLRACRRCRPDRFPDTSPEWYCKLLEEFRAQPSQRFTEAALADIAGVDISTVRRYFKQHHQCTPLVFHRRLRLEHARRMIESGADYLSAAYECGYESASGFREAFEREFGAPPGRFYARP